VEIFAIVRAKMPAKLVLLGDGPDREALDRISRPASTAAKRCLFSGQQDNVYEKLARRRSFPASFASNPSARPSRAMACEVPVIATTLAACPEVVHAPRGWFLGGTRRRGRSARYAIEILSRPDRGRKWAKIARIRSKKNYCANDVIPAYENYYKRVSRRILTAAWANSE